MDKTRVHYRLVIQRHINQSKMLAMRSDSHTEEGGGCCTLGSVVVWLTVRRPINIKILRDVLDISHGREVAVISQNVGTLHKQLKIFKVYEADRIEVIQSHVSRRMISRVTSLSGDDVTGGVFLGTTSPSPSVG